MDAPLEEVVAPRAPLPWAPLALGLLTLALTLYLAFQSSQLHVAERVLREHEALMSDPAQYKLYQAWKKVRYEGALVNGGQPMDDYQKLVGAARDLAERRAALSVQLQSNSGLLIVPPVLDELSPGNWSLFSEAHARTTEKPAEEIAQTIPDDVCSVPVPMPVAVSASAPRAVKVAPPPLRLQMLAAAHEREFACFIQTLQINPVSISYPMWGWVFDMRDKVNLLTSWLLPGLYGLLGACFFLMRKMLQAGPDHARHDGRAVAAVDILLRLAAGGLAGIIVGWFWVPTAGPLPLSSASSLSFGIAFLAGFSTDALFSLLDKLLKGVSPPDKPAPA